MPPDDALEFNEISRFYSATGKALTRRVIGGEDFAVAPYGRGYAALAEQKGRDFPAIRFALEYLPVAHDGPRHAFLRDLASRFLQSHNEVLRASRLKRCAEAAGRLARPGRFDLMREVVIPLVSGIGLDFGGESFTISPSLVFDANLSLRGRKQLEAEFARILAALDHRYADETRDSRGIRMAFMILANDATQGLIAANLGHVLRRHPGKAFAEIDWPQQPGLTGIVYIDRVAGCPFAHHDVTVPAGRTIRSDMASLVEGDPAAVFGVGRHVCLGRGFMQALWRDLGREVLSRPGRLVSLTEGPRSNRIFAIPDWLEIEVAA